MKNLTKIDEKFMTVKEVAVILGVSDRYVREKVCEFFPSKMQHGKTTYLNQNEITVIKNGMEKNPHLEQVFQVKTDQNKLEHIQQSMIYLTEMINKLKQDNARMAPKEIVHDRIMLAPGFMSLNETAKCLKVGRNKMCAFLRNQDVFMSGKRTPLPYQRYIDQGYFSVIETEKNDMIFRTTVVSQKGLGFITKLLGGK